jgi:hypothetical protein
MNGNRIAHILSLDKYAKDLFGGFSTPDIPIPKFSSLPSIVILNTALYGTAGEHWCTVCFSKNRSCDFFDPYARSPTEYGFTNTLLSACNYEIRFNEKPVQGFLSKTCGHHCLYFALKYARKDTPDSIMKSYHPFNKRSNDNMVFDYISRTAGSIIASIRD